MQQIPLFFFFGTEKPSHTRKPATEPELSIVTFGLVVLLLLLQNQYSKSQGWKYYLDKSSQHPTKEISLQLPIVCYIKVGLGPKFYNYFCSSFKSPKIFIFNKVQLFAHKSRLLLYENIWSPYSICKGDQANCLSSCKPKVQMVDFSPSKWI